MHLFQNSLEVKSRVLISEMNNFYASIYNGVEENNYKSSLWQKMVH